MREGMIRRAIVRLGPTLFLAGFLALLSGQSDPAGKTARAILEAKCVTCHGDLRTSARDLLE